MICLITLISLKGISDLVNKKTTKSYSMIFDTYNFNQESFYEFTSKQRVEVRKLDIIDEAVSYTHLTLPTNREV